MLSPPENNSLLHFPFFLSAIKVNEATGTLQTPNDDDDDELLKHVALSSPTLALPPPQSEVVTKAH